MVKKEEYNGVVDSITENIAYVTLINNHGEKFHGEYPADKLINAGIFERRRFTCEIFTYGNESNVNFYPVEDIYISPEEEVIIDRELDNLISGNWLDGDY